MSFIKKIGLVCFIVFCCAGCRSAGEKLVESAAAPRIINIINFIRQTDYRVENADSLLYETVCEQVKLVNKYDLPATFLLQYDALINPLYQDLLKSKLNDHSEIGAWWELTQPQIEARRDQVAWRAFLGLAREYRFQHRIYERRTGATGGCLYGEVQGDIRHVPEIDRLLVYRRTYLGVYVR